MANARFLKVIILVLVIINAGTVTFLWLHKPPHPIREDGRMDTFGFLVHELKLDDSQQEQYRKLRDDHHEKTEGLREKGRHMRDHFFELLKKPSADSADIQRLSDSIALNQKQIELLTYYHFREVRKICTPEQQKKFDDVIQDALHMMGPPPHQGPPPRP